MERVYDLASLLPSPCVIYKCVYGSRVFGLATESSDTDVRGVSVLPKSQFYGLDRLEQISDERSNEVYWELERFVTLLLKNNPHALETLSVNKDSKATDQSRLQHGWLKMKFRNPAVVYAHTQYQRFVCPLYRR